MRLTQERPVYVKELGQDDPRKCTARKMVQLSLAKSVSPRFHAPEDTLVLNPFAPQVLSPVDRDSRGILDLDCSWKRADEASFGRLGGRPRRIPILLAANPTNYARPGILSSVEAVAATLHVLGDVQRASRYLGIYKWGETFRTLNAEPLEEYRKAQSEQRVREIEREFFPQLVL
jgi:pre-rRNA-processing protein TSR3